MNQKLLYRLAETALRAAYPPTWRHLRHLRASQWQTASAVRSQSWWQLRQTLRHAYDTVPLYRDKFRAAGVTPQDIYKPEDLLAVPTVTKDELRAALRERWPLASDVELGDVASLVTTGSTGAPFEFPIDHQAEQLRAGVVFRNIEWYGHRLGDRNARLWRTDAHPPLPERLKRRVFGRRLEISTHDDADPQGAGIDERKLQGWCDSIRRYRPKALDGYVSALTLLARYILEQRLHSLGCQAVVTGGEYLSDHARKLIEEAFECPVFNRYGGTELGFVAHECGHHPDHKLHVNAEAVWLEFVVDGRHALPGELGEAIVTDFTNRAMPLIRYQVGDVGAPASPDEACPCGRGLPLIDKIEGRINDLFVLPDGRMLVSHVWHKLFRDKDFVREFQLVQRQKDLVQVDVVLDPQTHVNGQYESLKHEVERFLPGCTIVWNEVPAIARGAGGKLRHSISEVPIALNQIRTDDIPPSEALKRLKPYQVTSVQEALFLDDKDSVLKLDWNECTVPPAPGVKRRIVEFLSTDRVNWYADANQTEIRQAIAGYVGLEPEHVRVYGGSDSALDHIVRSFADASDELLLASPTYDQFRAYAELTGATVKQVVETDPFGDGLAEIEAAISRRTKLLYLANPNNPTGVYRTVAQIEELVAAHRSVLFVVDEAYIEFCRRGGSCAEMVRRHHNLIVSRTFSKAFSLAGMRCGYLLSDPGNLAVIDRIRNPREMNTLTLAAAVESLRNLDYYQAYVREVREARTYLVESLRRMGLSAFDTETNFILLRVPRPVEAIAAFKAGGIYVRDRAFGAPITNCVRISLGTKAEIERVLDVVRGMPDEIVRETFVQAPAAVLA